MKHTLPLFAALLLTPLAALSAAENAGAMDRHINALSPRFTQPAEDPAWVMPVGAGDLSAMLRYENAWEIHLSKTDFAGSG